MFDSAELKEAIGPLSDRGPPAVSDRVQRRKGATPMGAKGAAKGGKDSSYSPHRGRGGKAEASRFHWEGKGKDKDLGTGKRLQRQA